MKANRRLGTRGHPEESRAAILKAAVGEFAEHGIAGARTDAIARAAHVNKALLYYYFKDKDALYEAVLDHVFSGLRAQVTPVLDSDLPPRQKMLEYLGAYFDYIAANPRFPRVVQGEWVRSGAKGSAAMQRVARKYFRPIFEKLAGGVAGGDRSGGIPGGESYGFSAVGGGGDCVLFHSGAGDEGADEGRPVVGGADSGAAGVCAGVHYGGAVCFLALSSQLCSLLAVTPSQAGRRAKKSKLRTDSLRAES